MCYNSAMSWKVSIRVFNDHEVRAAWDEVAGTWLFSVVDMVEALTGSANPRIYWGVLKSRLKKAHPDLIAQCHPLKLTASDGKRYLTDCLEQKHLLALAEVVPSRETLAFLRWLTHDEASLDGQSRAKAYALFESGALEQMTPGTVECLKQIHAWLFGGLYDFAGQIREKNIAKGGFQFAMAQFLPETLRTIEAMPEDSFEAIVGKYVEMNVAHPFMEGNGRSTRLWLDLMLKRALKQCIDWSQIDKTAYLEAMRKSVIESAPLKALLQSALTSQINDRELFMKGIDYSYYYESDEPHLDPRA